MPLGWTKLRVKEVDVVKAAAGDQVVVETSHLSAHRREGKIVEVHDPDGAPPYLVHWSDTDTESLFFPGPDAHIVHVSS
jgi:hypothetical protein